MLLVCLSYLNPGYQLCRTKECWFWRETFYARCCRCKWITFQYNVSMWYDFLIEFEKRNKKKTLELDFASIHTINQISFQYFQSVQLFAEKPLCLEAKALLTLCRFLAKWRLSRWNVETIFILVDTSQTAYL